MGPVLWPRGRRAALTERDVTELQENLQAILDLVKRGEEVIVTENDHPIAALVHPARMGLRIRNANTEAQDPRFKRSSEKGFRKSDRGLGLDHDRAEAMIEDLRSDWEDRH